MKFKKSIFAGLCLLFSSTSFVHSQNLITNQWKFKTGDNLNWKDINFDDKNWANINTGMIWENLGYDNYDGYAWYRKAFIIPSTMQKEIAKAGGVSITLGTIDDADQTFFNGTLIGQSGMLPPDYMSAYDKVRNYFIKYEYIKWDKENVIAVRVYDEQGGGGILGKDVALKIGDFGAFVSMSVKFPNPQQVFINSKNIQSEITIKNESNINLKGQIEYILCSDFRDTISVLKIKANIQKAKSKAFNYKYQALKPGFYSLEVKLNTPLFVKSSTFNLGVDPEEIVSPQDKAPDFDNFWMRAKRELAAVEPQFKLIHKDSLSNEKRDVYLVEMRSLGNVLVRGWYIQPKAKGKFPAMLHVQGYSSNADIYRSFKCDSLAEFILNIRGHGNSRDEINPGFPGYLMNNLQDRERYIYRGAYMDCIRAIDFLCSREEVDRRYIMVEGGSQGGALSIATAALDNNRISLCMPSVPFLSDFKDYFKIAAWPGNEFTNYSKTHPNFGWEKIYENLSYFDIKNLASWVKCPVFMSIGLLDVTCPPHINFAAYNQLNVPKSYYVFPYAGHALPAKNNDLKIDWMKKELAKLKQENNTSK